MASIIIAGTGRAVPQKVLKNEDFPAMGIDTSDEWIRTRTGISERHIAEGDETTTSLAATAARMAIANAGIELKDIDLIVVGTLTPERPMPSAGCAVGHALGLNGVPAFDVYCACSGFIYGMNVAEGLMYTRGYKHALVIGAETLSKFTDWTDRSTCVLFGDGAGAVVLKAIDKPATGVIDSVMGADGSYGEALKLDHAGKIQMAGREIFKNAVTLMSDSVFKLLQRNNLKKEQVKLVIPHQANNRIIEAVSDRIEIGMENFFVNVDRYGNTSGASIPIALSEAVDAGKLQKDDYLMLVAFGGGLTWGGTLIKWD